MARPPRRFYSDNQTQQLINEYAPYLQSLTVPALAVRGVLQALLDEIPGKYLNREAALNHLMAELLHDNRELAEAARRAEDISSEDDETPEQLVQREQYLASLILESHGRTRVENALKEYSGHSIDGMRAESDNLLKALQNFPFDQSEKMRLQWLRENLAAILLALKAKNACFAGCPKLIRCPPDEGLLTLLRATSRTASNIRAGALKNGILAYFHGLSELRLADYLEGRRPKTKSRAQSAE